MSSQEEAEHDHSENMNSETNSDFENDENPTINDESIISNTWTKWNVHIKIPSSIAYETREEIKNTLEDTVRSFIQLSPNLQDAIVRCITYEE